RNERNIEEIAQKVELTETEAKELELGLISSFEYVVNGASLKCTGCKGEKSKILVTSQSSVRVTGQLLATVKDKEAEINIKRFKRCELASTSECMPRVKEWLEYHQDKYVNGENALIKKSYC